MFFWTCVKCRTAHTTDDRRQNCQLSDDWSLTLCCRHFVLGLSSRLFLLPRGVFSVFFFCSTITTLSAPPKNSLRKLDFSSLDLPKYADDRVLFEFVIQSQQLFLSVFLRSHKTHEIWWSEYNVCLLRYYHFDGSSSTDRWPRWIKVLYMIAGDRSFRKF